MFIKQERDNFIGMGEVFQIIWGLIAFIASWFLFWILYYSTVGKNEL
jgi:hypothetical protein